MPRPRIYESMTLIAARIDDDLLARFDVICDQVGVSRSGMLRIIIEHAVTGIEQGEFEISVTEVAPSEKPRRKRSK